MFKPLQSYTTSAGIPVNCSWTEENHRNTTAIQLGEMHGQKFWRARTTPKSRHALVVVSVKTEWQVFDENLPVFSSRWFSSAKQAVQKSVEVI